MNRYSALLSLLILMNVFSINAYRMDNKGFTTEKGFISWEVLIDMPKQMDRLDQKIQNMQRLLIIGSVAIAGYVIYSKWFKQPTQIVTDAQLNTTTDNQVA